MPTTRGMSAPPRPPAAAHAGAAGGRARAGTIRLGFFVGAGAHLVERGFARGFAHTPHPPPPRRGGPPPPAGGGGAGAARAPAPPAAGGGRARSLGRWDRR